MKYVIDIVDDINYTKSNCFAHQLHESLVTIPNVVTIPLSHVNQITRPDLVISRLKQRTLFRVAKDLNGRIKGAPVVVFDQDPWEAFRDGSPFKGSYTHIANSLNVAKFCVTTKWWAEFIKSKNLPAQFVSMGLLPRYCKSQNSRKIPLGFVGQVHPYRKKLFSELEQKHNIIVNVDSGKYDYENYLSKLSTIDVYIHSEDSPIFVEGSPCNLNVGLWIKDVEAAARGCFSVRNYNEEYPTYLNGIETVRLYKDIAEIPAIIESIERMFPEEKQKLIDRTVEFIRGSNKWQETALKLTTEEIVE